MNDGVRRPLSVHLLGAARTSPAHKILDTSPRIELRSELSAGRSAGTRMVPGHPDLVVVADARAGRRMRWRGHRTALWGDLELGAPDLVAQLAALAGRPGAGLHEGPPVSVVATVLQERGTVDALVARVGEQLQADDEMVVVDGGSSDGTHERLEELAANRSWLRVLQAPGTNISAGRNAAIATVIHRVVATTDAGCAPQPGWLDGLRMPFAELRPPGLVAGLPRIAAIGALQRAQAHACYPDPDELVRPRPWASAYSRVMGLGFDPRVPFARSLAFTVEAWRLAGGFPEELGWAEDGVFGTRVAEHLPCLVTRHAEVSWEQRGTLRQTFGMYRRYGIGAACSGDRGLTGHDLARGSAYAGAAALLLTARRRAFPALGTAVLAYTSLPLARVARHRSGPAAALLVPVAMLTKDLGKLTGATQAHWQHRSEQTRRGR